MSEQLSSDTAKGFAIAGAVVLGLIGLNQLGKRAARLWRNRSSDETAKDTTEK